MNVTGYASLFNVPDNGRDIMLKGAFMSSIRKRGAATIRFLWQHDRNNPIGVISVLREDGKGLYFEGEIDDRTLYGPTAVAMVEKKGIAVSIGYKTEKYEIDDDERIRRLKEVDLREVSLVSLPMCDGTDVWRSPTSNQISEGKSLADIERSLIDGLTSTVTASAQAVLFSALRAY